MKNRLRLFMFFIVCLSVLFSCNQGGDLLSVSGSQGENAAAKADADISPIRIIKDTGIIRYIPLEGGFYGIYGKLGKYDPINLPKEFKQDGLRVEFTATPATGIASIHMWGKLINLISMKTTNSEKQLIMDTGVLHQYMIQGSPWVIEATTGGYQPINLPREFQIENQKVNFVGVIRKDIIIIPPLWPIVELTSIQKVGEEPPIQVYLGQEFKLASGKKAQIKEAGILFTFKEVLQDSRCPIGAYCFWQGEAIVVVNVNIKGVDYGDFKISTYNPNTIYVGPYFIKFLDLYPYPSIQDPIDPAAYIGYFIIDSALEVEAKF